MVDELIVLYDGAVIPTYQCPNGVLVRVALISVNCDIPAARKVAGFMGQSAHKACNKCSTVFPRISTGANSSKPDFSNFDDEHWIMRDSIQQRREAYDWLNATHITQQKALQMSTGSKWSELHRLCYFDVVRLTTVDPMHNLFLGTPKRMIEVWESRGLLTVNDFKAMADESNSILIPSQYCKIPRSKDESSFSNMKSDEWRAWCVVLSPFLLKQKLSREHFDVWMKYVEAVKLVTGPLITVEDIEMAHSLFKDFGKTCVRLYGNSMTTPNMHMHMHLKECFLDFGPSYAFWLYGFERLNGNIKNVNINFKTGFETTYAIMFTQNVHTQDLIHSLHSFINTNNEDMLLLVKSIEEIGEVTSDKSGLTPFDYSRFIDGPSLFNSTITGSKPLPPSSYPLKFNKKTEFICHEHYDALKNYYMNTYAPITTNTYINTTIHSFKKITLLEQLYQPASDNSLLSSPSSFIQAIVDNQLRIGQISYFFTHSFGNNIHYFAFVNWYSHATQHFPTFDGTGIQVWKNQYEPVSRQNILPIHRIYNPVAVKPYIDNHILTLSLPRKIYM